jgi:hypothetical protein
MVQMKDVDRSTRTLLEQALKLQDDFGSGIVAVRIAQAIDSLNSDEANLCAANSSQPRNVSPSDK